jgi:hypothetical protein
VSGSACDFGFVGELILEVMDKGVKRLSRGSGSASWIGAWDGITSFEPGDDGGVGGRAVGRENGRKEVSNDESGAVAVDGWAGVEVNKELFVN